MNIVWINFNQMYVEGMLFNVLCTFACNNKSMYITVHEIIFFYIIITEVWWSPTSHLIH